MPSAVVVRDLSKRYGSIEALRGVSFSVEPGEVFGLLGPNGAGKTSAVECLVGLREPDGGEMEICGLDARRNPREVKQKIGVALQSTSLQDQVTPREALRLFGSFYREHTPPERLLERFQLEAKADAPFQSLSGGQRQRLALALAFVNRPQVVLLDEPTTGLDPQSRRELHEEIRRMRRDGCTVLLTTHYLEEAEQLCDRLAIVDQGRVVATGTPASLIADSPGQQAVVLNTTRPLDPESLSRLPGVREASVSETSARLRTSDAAGTLAALGQLLKAREIDVVDLQIRKATLEDVFLQLTRRLPPG